MRWSWCFRFLDLEFQTVQATLLAAVSIRRTDKLFSLPSINLQLLFAEVDNLLLLAKGGKTVDFGDLDNGAKTLFSDLERNGAPKCDPQENPAEYMLHVVCRQRKAAQAW